MNKVYILFVVFVALLSTDSTFASEKTANFNVGMRLHTQPISEKDVCLNRIKSIRSCKEHKEKTLCDFNRIKNDCAQNKENKNN